MRTEVPNCNVPYSTANEDHASYGVGWTNLPFFANGTQEEPLYEYTYTSAQELDSFPFWATHAVSV